MLRVKTLFVHVHDKERPRYNLIWCNHHWGGSLFAAWKKNLWKFQSFDINIFVSMKHLQPSHFLPQMR